MDKIGSFKHEVKDRKIQSLIHGIEREDTDIQYLIELGRRERLNLGGSGWS